MTRMSRITLLMLLFLLAGCAGTATPLEPTACSTAPGSFECQVERYSNAGM